MRNVGGIPRELAYGRTACCIGFPLLDVVSVASAPIKLPNGEARSINPRGRRHVVTLNVDPWQQTRYALYFNTTGIRDADCE
jgi:hypothetical protein